MEYDTFQLEQFGNDLADSYESLYENTHEFVKLPHFAEISAAVEGFKLENTKKFSAPFDPRIVYEESYGLIDRAAPNFPADNKSDLADYISNVMNIASQTICSHEYGQMHYGIFLQDTDEESASFGWHIDADEKKCSIPRHATMVATLRGDTTVYFDVNNLDTCYNASNVDAVKYTEERNALYQLGNSDVSPVNVDFSNSGYASLHSVTDSVHTAPAVTKPNGRITIVADCLDVIYGWFYSEDF